MDKQKEIARAQIEARLQQISTLYDEITQIGSEHDMTFKYEGPAGYGDSGWFSSGEWQPSSVEGC